MKKPYTRTLSCFACAVDAPFPALGGVASNRLHSALAERKICRERQTAEYLQDGAAAVTTGKNIVLGSRVGFESFDVLGVYVASIENNAPTICGESSTRVCPHLTS